jgi:hypothetical protein
MPMLDLLRVLFVTILALAVTLPAPRIVPLPPPEAGTLRWRGGVGVGHSNPLHFDWPLARPGWFHNWDFDIHTLAGGYHEPLPRFALAGAEQALGMEFAPLIRTLGGVVDYPPARITALAQRYPGLAWIVGNEPDIRTQDWATPAEYARAYHLAYTAIKAGDPTATVVAGNISQVTPLRLRYLDAVRTAYRLQFGAEMPVDVWGVHLYILPEQGDWGAGLPPGQEGHAVLGVTWGADEHGDLARLAEQVTAMRRWQAGHGAQATPLWVTEYGILLPAELGFTPARVARFLTASMTWFVTATDPTLGLPQDDQRLVQRWVWFSTHAPEYPAGNLFDAHGAPTPIMAAYAEFLAGER